jgi:NAD(P)-dependent dehydrogenase (short-subunit alcohol dehydrogenase family)
MLRHLVIVTGASRGLGRAISGFMPRAFRGGWF